MKDRGKNVLIMLTFSVVYLNLGLCRCLNEEGFTLLKFRDRIDNDPFGALRGWREYDGETDPCSWFGIECSDGKVSALNLKDLCLEGTLAPEIGNLAHIKSIILRNNTFSGVIPEEIGELKGLELLDLGYNNFSGPLPFKLGKNFSPAILFLDKNELLDSLSPEIYNLKSMSESQVDENSFSTWTERVGCKKRLSADGRLLLEQDKNSAPSPKGSRPPPPPPPPSSMKPRDSPPSLSPPLSSPSPSPSPSQPTPSSPPISLSAPPPPSLTTSSQPDDSGHLSKVRLVTGITVGGSALIFFIMLGIYLYKRNKTTLVKSWTTDLSGQLHKALVADATPPHIAGIPKLRRSELEIACEDFSNVVGTSSIGTIYKGTLSTGTEIAVASIAVKYDSNWSRNVEAQFIKKIETLSQVNHKNFVNLVGYCQEDEPFTRMMVFEYAPNGTLFEHLHVKEAEHLDWGTRMRIAMGMSYCLEHMHQLNPPIPHRNLTSSAITLTEDYAAKISDFNFWNQGAASEIESIGVELVENYSSRPERNVYSFGVVLFEMVTGRIPYSIDNGTVDDWASDYVRGDKPLAEMVDSSLGTFDADQLEKVGGIIRSCAHPDPQHRPSMSEVSSSLRVVTKIPPEAAVPKISPLWWAELEVFSKGD
ncbi:hypothetical protein SAY87_001170 [Trapa incisa]|uniref:Protein kinase domain-containing protein n=1 Tax=Trapa incisa TaxID=236973 RepID=A0AAN7JGR5_9MYRT|nr:hypothetical protein SAY87_001170 [Trapa incisa]